MCEGRRGTIAASCLLKILIDGGAVLSASLVSASELVILVAFVVFVVGSRHCENVNVQILT